MEEIVLTQQPFSQVEAIFYAAVWCVGACTGMARAGRDRDFRDCRNLISIGVVSGFFAFAVVGIMYRWFGDPGTDEFFFLALSALLGLLGKEQDQWIRHTSALVLRKFGMQKDDTTQEDTTPD